MPAARSELAPDLTRLLRVLGEAQIGDDLRGVADALWLAGLLPARSTGIVDSTDAESPPAAGPRSPAAAASVAAPEPRWPTARRPSAVPTPPARVTGHAGDGVAGVYVGAAGTAGLVGRPAERVRVPGAPALPRTLELARALRPFSRRYESRHRVELDEDATAEHSADARAWRPVLRPARERWFDVDVVSDGSASMTVWSDVVTEFARLLERHGAFSRVRRWTLRVGAAGPTLVDGAGAERRLRELRDPRGRRLVLVLSDGASGWWRDPTVTSAVADWGRNTPVALVHMLPRRMWRRTALGAPGALMRAVVPGAPNAMLEVERPWWAPDLPVGAVPLPVTGLEPRSLAAWAPMVMASGPRVGGSLMRGPLRSDAHAAHPEHPATEAPVVEVADEAEVLVSKFRARVSPEAFRLAAYLTVVPLTLPVIRVVQKVLTRRPEQSQIAEVLLGGLLEQVTAAGAGSQPQEIVFDFVSDGVREVLGQSVLRSEAVEVLREVSDFIGARSGQPVDFAALVELEGGTSSIPEGAVPFAHLGSATLQRLGVQPRRVVPISKGPVYLSYARSASGAFARQLHAALTVAGFDVFTDEDELDVRYGDPIPGRLADALLGARVVVVFLEPVYFTRWYCRLEYRLATALFAHDARAAARHVVLAFPDSAAGDAWLADDLGELPPSLRHVSWPTASNADALVSLVAQRLAVADESIGASLDRHVRPGAARDILAAPAALPQPLPIAAIPSVMPATMPGTLREAFIGHEDDLWWLHHALAPAEQRVGHAALTAALKGMGGVGKTQLAAEYFWRYGPRHYTGGLFWLDARSDVAEQHHAVLRALGDTGVGDDFVTYRERVGAPRAAAVLAERLARWLRAVPRERPVLLVVDDVPEPDAPLDASSPTLRLQPLETWCPAPEAVACLATSRGLVGFRRGAALARREVGVLAPEAAVALLTREVTDVRRLTPAEWREVAEWVGRLPLALAVLNRALQPDARALYPERVLEAARAGASLAAHQDRTAARLVNADDTLRGPTLAFRLSFDSLPEPAQRVVRRLACLSPAPIPLALAEAVAPEGMDADDLTHALTLLLARSFVSAPSSAGDPGDRLEEGPAAPVPMYGSMHALLADAVRAFSPDFGGDVRAVVVALRAAFTPDRGRNPLAWPLLAAGVPHALAAVARAEPAGGADVGGLHDVSPAGSPSVDLLLRVGLLVHDQGDYGAARAACERAQVLAERLLGPDHPSTLTSANNLAATLVDLGDLAGARAQHERVLAALTRVLGPEHPDTLTSASNLAATLRALGDPAGARAQQEQVLAGFTRVLGPEHPDTLTSASNLAATLHALGDLAGARALEERVLATRTRVLGPEHPDTLTSANNLAATLHALGDPAGAGIQHERVLAARERLLGPEHPETLASVSNLAEVLVDSGDLAGARAQQERVLAARTRLLGPEHPATLGSAHNLARTLADLGDLAGARALQERVLDVLGRVLGSEHPATLASAGNLAAMLYSQGDLAGARAQQERVLAIYERLLGPEHPDTLTAAHNLAETLRACGDLAGARALQERVLSERARSLGPEHPETLASAYNLAATNYVLGDHTTARALLQRVVDTRTRVLGATHPDTVAGMRGLELVTGPLLGG